MASDAYYLFIYLLSSFSFIYRIIILIDLVVFTEFIVFVVIIYLFII